MSNINVNNITPVTGETISISGSLFVSGTFAGALNTTFQISSSQNYLSGSSTEPLGLGVTGSILPGTDNSFSLGSPTKTWKLFANTMHVSGNLLPAVPSDSITSSFSLGSPSHVWKDLYVSEDSIKFIKKSGSGAPEELARISIDTGSGKMKFLGLTDHKDLELRQTQFGKSSIKGATINDGGGEFSTFVAMAMQHREVGIKGGAMVNRPESADLGYLGSDFVAHSYQAKGSGSIAMLIDADGTNENRSFFRVEKSGIAGAGTKLLTVKPNVSTFHGANNLVTIEGASSLSGSQVLSASNVDGTPAASFEIDASNSSQVAGFQIGIGNNNPITASSELLSYYDVSNSMFDTSSAAASFMAYGALGVQMANNPNVIIENGVVSTNGTISSSMVIGRALHPANALFENGEVYISQGTIVRVLQGSKFIIQDQQPDITADSDTGTITLSDPTINGGGDVIINPDNGGNPSVINQSTTIPANQVSYWTMGDNLPGTYGVSFPFNTPPLNNNVGIQIGASISILHDGVIINGEVLFQPNSPSPQHNIKLRIEDGAQLYIQPASVITTNDDGDTEVDGNVVIDGNVAEGFSNDAQVTSSLTLSVATHGLGKQVFVRSGSSPLLGIDTSLYITASHPFYGLPALTSHGAGLLGQTGQYVTTGSQAGVIRLELPSASVGMTFDIKNAQQTLGGGYKSPELLVTPNGSERFIIKANGSSGTNGKGVFISSGSNFPMQRVHITCQSGSDWTIINLLGPWQDEA